MTADEKIDKLIDLVGEVRTAQAVTHSKVETVQEIVEKQNGRVGRSEDEILLLKKDMDGLPDRVRSLENFKVKVVAYASVAGAALGMAGDWVKHKIGG